MIASYSIRSPNNSAPVNIHAHLDSLSHNIDGALFIWRADRRSVHTDMNSVTNTTKNHAYWLSFSVFGGVGNKNSGLRARFFNEKTVLAPERKRKTVLGTSVLIIFYLFRACFSLFFRVPLFLSITSSFTCEHYFWIQALSLIGSRSVARKEKTVIGWKRDKWQRNYGG